MNKNKKRMAKGIAAAALIGVIAVGSTLAYLSSQTETKTNTFTSGKNITANITETEWDESESYIPGEAKAKNPVVQNVSGTDGEPMWTGVKIQFKDESGNYIAYTGNDGFAAKYGTLKASDPNTTTNYINKGWTQLQDAGKDGLFIAYDSLVKPGEATDPAVFDEILVSFGLTKKFNETYTTTKVYPAKKNPDGSYLMKDGKYVADEAAGAITSSTSSEVSTVIVDTNGERHDDVYVLPVFDVEVTGYAVQDSTSDGFNHGNELLKLAGFSPVA